VAANDAPPRWVLVLGTAALLAWLWLASRFASFP
jgi:hypothetical protein